MLVIFYSVYVPKNYESLLSVDKVIAIIIGLRFLAHPVLLDYTVHNTAEKRSFASKRAVADKEMLQCIMRSVYPYH